MWCPVSSRVSSRFSPGVASSATLMILNNRCDRLSSLLVNLRARRRKLLGMEAVATAGGVWPWEEKKVGVTPTRLVASPFPGAEGRRSDSGARRRWTSTPSPALGDGHGIDSCEDMRRELKRGCRKATSDPAGRPTEKVRPKH